MCRTWQGGKVDLRLHAFQATGGGEAADEAALMVPSDEN